MLDRKFLGQNNRSAINTYRIRGSDNDFSSVIAENKAFNSKRCHIHKCYLNDYYNILINFLGEWRTFFAEKF